MKIQGQLRSRLLIVVVATSCGANDREALLGAQRTRASGQGGVVPANEEVPSRRGFAIGGIDLAHFVAAANVRGMLREDLAEGATGGLALLGMAAIGLAVPVLVVSEERVNIDLLAIIGLSIGNNAFADFKAVRTSELRVLRVQRGALAIGRVLVRARISKLLSRSAEVEVPLEERDVVLLARVVVALKDRGHIGNSEGRGRSSGSRGGAALGMLGIRTTRVARIGFTVDLGLRGSGLLLLLGGLLIALFFIVILRKRGGGLGALGAKLLAASIGTTLGAWVLLAGAGAFVAAAVVALVISRLFRSSLFRAAFISARLRLGDFRSLSLFASFFRASLVSRGRSGLVGLTGLMGARLFRAGLGARLVGLLGSRRVVLLGLVGAARL